MWRFNQTSIGLYLSNKYISNSKSKTVIFKYLRFPVGPLRKHKRKNLLECNFIIFYYAGGVLSYQGRGFVRGVCVSVGVVWGGVGFCGVVMSREGYVLHSSSR